MLKNGPVRDLNPGPPAPKAGIIPLDQQAGYRETAADSLYVLRNEDARQGQ